MMARAMDRGISTPGLGTARLSGSSASSVRGGDAVAAEPKPPWLIPPSSRVWASWLRLQVEMMALRYAERRLHSKAGRQGPQWVVGEVRARRRLCSGRGEGALVAAFRGSGCHRRLLMFTTSATIMISKRHKMGISAWGRSLEAV